MPDAVRLYALLLRASVRGQMQYRAAFLLQMIGRFVLATTEIAGIWVFFDRFKGLGGWSLEEVALLYGIVNVSFTMTDCVGRGFDSFGGMIRGGGFDLVLVRPRAAALQVAGRELHLAKAGRGLQGLVVLGWAISRLPIAWSPVQALTLGAAVLGGACMFYGLIVCQATLCFWTVDSLELFNILTYGGTETGQYPVTVYRDWFRRLFTWIVPLAAVTYFPAVALLGRADPLGTSRAFQRVAPLLGAVFLAGSFLVWRVGVRHYRSTGS